MWCCNSRKFDAIPYRKLLFKVEIKGVNAKRIKIWLDRELQQVTLKP